jgi:hypothetical protein
MDTLLKPAPLPSDAKTRFGCLSRNSRTFFLRARFVDKEQQGDQCGAQGFRMETARGPKVLGKGITKDMSSVAQVSQRARKDIFIILPALIP